jgi:hypothetical protein
MNRQVEARRRQRVPESVNGQQPGEEEIETPNAGPMIGV